MAFLVAAIDDFLVAATDDFLVTADDTFPGTGIGFENVTVGVTAATWARIGPVDLAGARVGSFVIWEEVIAPAMAPAPAGLDLTGFAPTIAATNSVSAQPGSAAMATSGFSPVIVIFSPGSTVTLIAPGGIALTSPAASSALPAASSGISFVFDY